MNETLTRKWSELRGISVVSIAMNSVSIPEEDAEKLKELQRELDITMMMVTHDQEEAFSLSDRIVLMRRGVIVADAPPIDLYETTGNPFIQTFIIDQINKRARYIWNLKRGDRR